MAMNDARIRRIIREEARRVLLESSGGMSILPPDVPVDLYVGYFRRMYKHHPNWVAAFSPSKKERLVKIGLDSMLSQQEAEELSELGIMCVGPGKDFPFSIDEAPRAVIESLGYDPRRAKKLINTLRRNMYENLGKIVDISIFWKLSHGWSAGEFNRIHNTPRGLRPELEALQAIDRAELERGIEMMDSLYEFAEKVRSAPKSIRQKLMKIIGPDGSGFLQAVEIYSSL